jgi:hypothetical protein
MAYLGSTQATSLANPPRCIVPRFSGAPASTQLSTAVPSDGSRSAYNTQGGAVWLYASSHGSTATMDSNFFSDALYIGMRPGDLLIGYQWTTLGSSIVTYMGVLGSVSTAGAALSTGGTITSTFA